jgi:hypothetical protein
VHQVPVGPGTSDSVTFTSSPMGEICTPADRVIAKNTRYGIRICEVWPAAFPHNRTYLAWTDVVTLYRDVPPFR